MAPKAVNTAASLQTAPTVNNDGSTEPAQTTNNISSANEDAGEDGGSDNGTDYSDYTDSECSCPLCQDSSQSYHHDRDEIEELIERKNRLYVVDEEGVMQWLCHESSYTLAELNRRDPGVTHLYDFASTQELRKYVRDRGLPDPYPRGLTLKYFYIRVLEQADEAKSFRFLELPAEMRNLIYAELLTFGRCPSCPRIHEACQTGILQSCKQVYKESRNILYGDNLIRCSFRFSGEGEDPADFFSWMHTKEMHSQADSMDLIFLGMSQIPDWFRRVQHLRIDLAFCGGAVAVAGFKFQACLLNLASFLMDDHSLKMLEVHIIDSSGEVEDYDGLDDYGENVGDKLNAVIYPLRRLRGIERVEIYGVNKDLALRTATDMRRISAPGFNTLLHFNNLREEAKAFSKVMQSVDPYNSGRGVPLGYGGHVSHDLEMLVDELGDYVEMDEDYSPFADAKTEVNTRRKMEDLRDCLAKLQFADFENRKKEFIKLRKARTAYQMRAKWVYVDGKKKKADLGLRRDWEPRLDADDDYLFW